MKNDKQANSAQHNLRIRNAIETSVPCFILPPPHTGKTTTKTEARRRGGHTLIPVRGDIFLCIEEIMSLGTRLHLSNIQASKDKALQKEL